MFIFWPCSDCSCYQNEIKINVSLSVCDAKGRSFKFTSIVRKFDVLQF